MEIVLNEKLKHLNADDIDALISRYYADERIADLIEEYKIDVRPSGLVGLFPPKKLDYFCKYCEEPMYQFYKSKSYAFANPPKCLKCGHEDSSNCQCENCDCVRKIAAEDEQSRKIRLVESYFEIEDFGPFQEPQDLSLREAVFLITFYRGCVGDDMATGELSNLDECLLSPTEELTATIIRYLRAAEILNVDPTSDPRAFVWNEKEVPEQFYINSVKYRLLLGEDPNFVCQYIKDLESIAYSSSSNWPRSWIEDSYYVWKELVLHECLQYFEYIAEEHGLKAPLGDKTRLMFENLMCDFTLGQIYNFIWRSGQSAASYYMRKEVPRKRAGNAMVGYCQRSADRARTEGWEVKSYDRNYNCARSELNCALHDVFLHSGDRELDLIVAPLQVQEESDEGKE
ncbi:MAG: hypothetical protein PVI75_04770 [Gammaproteobacteria bacterium]|jgi:hypothetical protein